MTSATPDPYAVLGVTRDASGQEIRRAYRRLAKRHHPDVRAGRESGEQMRRVNQAWETLSDPSRRARYDTDATRRSSPAAANWSTQPRPRTPGEAPAAAWRSTWAYAGGSRPSAETSRPYDDRAVGPGLGAVMAVAIAAVAFIVLLGSVPLPLLGIVGLLAARLIFGR